MPLSDWVRGNPLVTRLEGLREQLRASFWFLPGLMAVVAACLAILLVAFQSTADRQIGRLMPWLFQGEPESARSVLSAIAGSMATVAAMVFSVTMVALTLAAGQFSPRVLRTFMRDRTNQVVLGGFVATFTYALIVLRGVRTGEEGVPNLAITVGFLLALGAMILLILFIHHVAESVQVATVLDGITEETIAQIPVLFPAPIGQGEAEPRPVAETGEAVTVRSETHGYVQVLDYDRLLRAAAEADVVVRLTQGPGDFVSFGSRLATVMPAERCTAALAGTVRSTFVLDRYPSIEHDVQFGIRQIVDIGIKALSPGVNDPTTATNAVDYLGVILSHAIGRQVPSPHRRADGDGRLRVIAMGPTYASMVHLAFDQICLYGKGDPRVMKRVLETLAHLAELTADLERRAALVEVADEAMAWAARGLPESDRAPLERLAGQVRAGRAPESPAAKVVH